MTNPTLPFSLDLLVYPNSSEYIAKLIIPKTLIPSLTKSSKPSEITTIVILDRSGSMSDQVERFVNRILPGLFSKLDYPPDRTIYLITFDSQTEKIVTTVGELPNLNITDRGSTQMAAAVEEVKKLIKDELGNNHEIYRILTVSDGDVWDQEETQRQASVLVESVKEKTINSQAVRLFTSCSQPDTRALSSILQINNVVNVNLLDLTQELPDEAIVNEIGKLFEEDGLVYKLNLISEEEIIKKLPWSMEYTKTMTVLPGENIFWLKTLPQTRLLMENIPINVIVKPQLDLDTYAEIFKTKIQHYMTQLKILKVVGTKESSERIENIVSYFRNSENSIISQQEDVQTLLNDGSLRSRYEYLKALIARRSKTFSMAMSQIANDEKISLLNSAQQAEYLRSVVNTRNSRGLARRALNQGIDFNSTIRGEIRKMSENISELDGIDDKDHTVSFSSCDTTLGGIRTVCQIVADDFLDEMEANDIFLMINIVGIGCSGPIGDYPDPMTWRVNDLHLGSYVSLSDVLLAKINDCELKSPGTDKIITNVIPIFDDRRIPKFLRKHCPSLLEYMASVGMRRIVAEVPMTLGYTLCAGVWKSVELLNKNKSELYMKSFARLTNEYSSYVGEYFDHILPHIREQNNGTLQYYIANNGITNMINPLFKIYKSEVKTRRDYVPGILRNLYSFEIWQAIRRLYKNQDNADKVIKDVLYKLLGIDLEKNRTQLAPMYELEPETIEHSDEYKIDDDYFKELSKSFRYVKYVTLLPKYFETIVDSRPELLKNIPELSDDTITRELDVNYDLKTFVVYNIVQALLYTTKTSRVDTETETMKIHDLKNKTFGEKMIKEYVRKQFHNQYLSELAKKKRTEQIELSHYLVESVFKSNETASIVELMKTGITKGKISLKITNASSLGYAEMKQKLTDLKIDIPLRLEIIRIFLLGRDPTNEPVWNNGGVNFVTNLTDFGNVLKSLNLENEWNDIAREYKERGLHIYRELLNRHGHGNPKPSYWAFGYPTLEHYRKDVDEEEFTKYCKEHSECCGVKQLLELLNLTV